MQGRKIRNSNLKRKRKNGFRARMKSRHGRKAINNRRRIGRKLDFS